MYFGKIFSDLQAPFFKVGGMYYVSKYNHLLSSDIISKLKVNRELAINDQCDRKIAISC